MALPSKGQRRILVDGVEYAWVSKYIPDRDDDPYAGEARLVIQRRTPPSGQLLVATIYDVATIDRGLVARAIRWARADLGWKPEQHDNTPLRAAATLAGLLEAQPGRAA
jgi:hypothetical protein